MTKTPPYPRYSNKQQAISWVRIEGQKEDIIKRKRDTPDQIQDEHEATLTLLQ